MASIKTNSEQVNAHVQNETEQHKTEPRATSRMIYKLKHQEPSVGDNANDNEDAQTCCAWLAQKVNLRKQHLMNTRVRLPKMPTINEGDETGDGQTT
jgi:hypothetical protein